MPQIENTASAPLVPWGVTSTAAANWSPRFVPGPYFSSFEQFRTAGSTVLDAVTPGSIATLANKAGVFRILRDDDFQRLLGLAAEVHRIKGGVRIVLRAARVVAKHQDRESIELLINSASLLSESCVLPEKEGHDAFEITPEEAAANRDDAFEIGSVKVRRPKL